MYYFVSYGPEGECNNNTKCYIYQKKLLTELAWTSLFPYNLYRQDFSTGEAVPTGNDSIFCGYVHYKGDHQVMNDK